MKGESTNEVVTMSRAEAQTFYEKSINVLKNNSPIKFPILKTVQELSKIFNEMSGDFKKLQDESVESFDEKGEPVFKEGKTLESYMALMEDFGSTEITFTVYKVSSGSKYLLQSTQKISIVEYLETNTAISSTDAIFLMENYIK